MISIVKIFVIFLGMTQTVILKYNLDYPTLCQDILNSISQRNRPLFVSDTNRGGIGHKSLSIVQALLFSILNNRQYYSKRSWYIL